MAGEAAELVRRFEQAVADALATLAGTKITRMAGFGADIGADFRLEAETPEGKATVLVEAKLYTSRFPHRSLLTIAVNTLRAAMARAGAEGGILATTFDIGSQAESVVDVPKNIVVLGINDLLALAADNPQTYSELLEISRAIRGMRHDYSEAIPEPTSRHEHDLLSSLFIVPHHGAHIGPVPTPTPEATEAEAIGHRICSELDAIPSGKDAVVLPDGTTIAAWRLFEQKCEEAVRYIFEAQLENWDSQTGPDDGMHKYDLLAKIKAGDEAFWESLIMDFRTRYVVFEFKNYGEKIGQNIVYVTEKYLFPTAMRSTAIIISPEGPDDSAITACKGALRDAGKLIINLTRKHLCELLKRRDAGEEPSVYMAGVLDDILRNVDR